jgi:hypothetical protein
MAMLFRILGIIVGYGGTFWRRKWWFLEYGSFRLFGNAPVLDCKSGKENVGVIIATNQHTNHNRFQHWVKS